MTTGFQLRQAARTLRAGGLVLYPTEGVWGLGCDPLNPGAVEAILTLKSRPLSKGLILIARQRAQLAPFVSDPDAIPETETPTTWVVPATAHCLPWLTGGRRTIAVRLTTHPVAASLCVLNARAKRSNATSEKSGASSFNALTVARCFSSNFGTSFAGATTAAACSLLGLRVLAEVAMNAPAKRSIIEKAMTNFIVNAQ